MRATDHVPRHPTYTGVVLDYLISVNDLVTIKQIEDYFRPRERWVADRRLDYETIYTVLRNLSHYKAVESMSEGRARYYMATPDADERRVQFETWAERKDAHVPKENRRAKTANR